MNKLLQIQSELNAPKNLNNSFGGYKYRSCESILEALKPLLKTYEATLILSDAIIAVGNRIYIEATAVLTANGSEIGRGRAYAREEETKKGMDAAQISGSCSSYARKYALNGLFLIDDTKDQDTDEHHKEVDDLASKAAQARAKYHVDTEKAAMPVPCPANDAKTGHTNPAHTDLGAVAPKQGLSATGKVLTISEPNKGGYCYCTLEGYVEGNDYSMRFSTKNPDYIAMLAECVEKGDKAHIDYNNTVSGKFTNHNIDNVTVISDEVPF
jgi:hypothetical protein